MKTEQEQIEQIEKVLKDSVADYKHLKKKGVCYCYAETLIDHGYGDISEYKTEIERLKKETGYIRKGAAKEILQTLYNKCYEINDETGESMGNFVSDDDILCLAKHYGVEVVV